jgi:hypothetical protein
MKQPRILAVLLIVLVAALSVEEEECIIGCVNGVCDDAAGHDCTSPSAVQGDAYEESDRERIRRISDRSMGNLVEKAHAALELGWVVVTMHTMQQVATTAGFMLLCFDTGHYPPNITKHEDDPQYERVTANDQATAKLMAHFWQDWLHREATLEHEPIMKGPGGVGESEFARSLTAENRSNYLSTIQLFHMWAEHYPASDSTMQLFHSSLLELSGKVLRGWEVAHKAALAYPMDHRLRVQELRLRSFGNPYGQPLNGGVSSRISGNPYGSEHTGPMPTEQPEPMLKGCWLPIGEAIISRLECCFTPLREGDWFLHGEKHRRFWHWEAIEGNGSGGGEKEEMAAAIRDAQTPRQSAKPQWSGKRVALLYHGNAALFGEVWKRQQSHIIEPLRSEGASIVIYGSLRSSGDDVVDQQVAATLSAHQHGDSDTVGPIVHFEDVESKAVKGDLIAAGLRLVLGGYSLDDVHPPVGGRNWDGVFPEAVHGAGPDRTYHRGGPGSLEDLSSRYDFVVAAELRLFPKVSALAWPVDFGKLNVPFRKVDPQKSALCTCLVAATVFGFPPAMARRVLRGCGPGDPYCHGLGGTFRDVHLWLDDGTCFEENTGWAPNPAKLSPELLLAKRALTKNPYFLLYNQTYAHTDVDGPSGAPHEPGAVFTGHHR